MKRLELRQASLQDEGNQLGAFPGKDWRKNNRSSSKIVLMPFFVFEAFFLSLSQNTVISSKYNFSAYFILGLKIKSIIFFFLLSGGPSRARACFQGLSFSSTK